MDVDTAAPWTQQEHLVIISLAMDAATVTQLDRSNKADRQSVCRSVRGFTCRTVLKCEAFVRQLSETQRSHGGVDPA